MASATNELPAGVIRWGKLPVPYVAAWSSEQGWRVDVDPVVGKPCLFVAEGRRGLGTPMFGKMDPARVRRVIAKRLCQVCAQPLGLFGYVADVVLTRQGGHPVVNEPPACRRCFALAVLQCPGIERQRAKRGFLAAAVTRYQPLLVLLQPAADGDAALNRVLENRKVYGYARPALVDYQPINLAELVQPGGLA